ncbi:hypothetical protein YTPLAS18_30880 [Nitrospira sp.]|nr:hypothetical protein YTPLAS18_30880 [Nitrospira sp.]
MSHPSRWFPTCRDMSRLLSDAMDARLPWHVRARMHVHLRICTLCEAYQHHLALLRSVLRHDGAPQIADTTTPPQSGLSAEAKERIRRTLDSSRS